MKAKRMHSFSGPGRLLAALAFFAIVGGASAGAAGPEGGASGVLTGPVGSGNGAIHVIPSLSAPSVKNGASLAVQAVVKAAAGVERVEARIVREGDATGAAVAALTLAEAPASLGGAAPGGTVGLWQAEWTASGLVEAQYRVALTVTDRAGGTHTDRSLVFSDPIAGNSDPGTTDYPDGGMRHLGAAALEGEDYFRSAVVDVHHGYAYFGTGTSPGRVVKVALGDGSAPPRRVGSVTLEPGENLLRCAVVNLNWVSGFYAYFGTYTSPGRVVKVALGDGDAPPTRVNALTLNSGENNLCCAVADTDSYAVHGYFGTDTAPGSVVKVELTVGAVLPKRVGTVDFPTQAGAPACAVYRPTDDHVYFGTNASPGWVVKLARGASGATPPGATPPQWTGHVVLATGEDNLASATYYGDCLYFGTRTATGRVVKVARGTGSAAPSRVGAVTLQTGEGYLTSAFNYRGVYFGTNTSPGRVIKVAAGAAGAAPTRAGALILPSSDYSLRSAVDTQNGYAFFGTNTIPGRAVKLSLGQLGFVKGGAFTMPEDGDVQSVSFYAHVRSGDVRLAVYDNGSPPALLWESPATAVPAGGQWMSIPVGNGTPSSLFLPAGAYRLAWQTLSWDDVPGYTPGAAGGGFELPWTFGAFPEALDTAHGATPTATDAAWAQYLAYNVPPAGSIVINGNRSLTNSHNVVLSLAWNPDWGSGVSRMRFSNNGYTWSAWEPVAATRAWALAEGDGYRTVRVQFRDTSGNASDRYSDYIRVDATPPTGTIVINNNRSATTTPDVTLSLTWDDAGGSGVTRMRFSNDGATWSPWEPLSATRAHTLPPVPGHHTVRVTYRDGAGNVSDRFSDYIRLDIP